VENLLTELHGGPSGGHLCVNKTLNKIRHRYYCLQVRNHIETWCRQCDVCAASLPRVQEIGPKEPKQCRRTIRKDSNLCRWTIQLSDQGNRYSLIAIDYFTKWPEAYSLPIQEASTVAEALVTNFFCRFGIPWKLHSDQSRNFESRLLHEILQCLGLRKTRTTPLHP
jgi:hypothetical protein